MTVQRNNVLSNRIVPYRMVKLTGHDQRQWTLVTSWQIGSYCHSLLYCLHGETVRPCSRDLPSNLSTYLAK